MVSVPFFLPNIIGYVRIISLIISLFYAFTNFIVFIILYSVSQLLDAVDGTAARRYNMTSRYGAVLDMVTDRVSTASLLVILSILYYSENSYIWVIFCLCIILDIFSHWVCMYSKLLVGADNHKDAQNYKSNIVLRFYYNAPGALFVFCVGNEVFLLVLYIIKFLELKTTLFTTFYYTGLVTFFIFLSKQFISVVQLFSAMSEIALWDTQNRKYSEIDSNEEKPVASRTRGGKKIKK